MKENYSAKKRKLPLISVITIESNCTDCIGYYVTKEYFVWDKKPDTNPVEETYVHLYDKIDSPSPLFSGFCGVKKPKGKNVNEEQRKAQTEILEFLLKDIEEIRKPYDFVVHWYHNNISLEMPRETDFRFDASIFDYNISIKDLYYVLEYKKGKR
jgi:hypothetical protein